MLSSLLLLHERADRAPQPPMKTTFSGEKNTSVWLGRSRDEELVHSPGDSNCLLVCKRRARFITAFLGHVAGLFGRQIQCLVAGLFGLKDCLAAGLFGLSDSLIARLLRWGKNLREKEVLVRGNVE